MSDRRALSASSRALTVWGLDAVALHDRYWASMGIDVVRCGQRSPTRQAACFMLLDRDQLVLFTPPRVPRRCRLLRVSVCDPRGRGYAEQVQSDAAGRVRGITRRYEPPRPRRATVRLTTDRSLAAHWRSAPSCHRGRCAVRVAAGIDGERRVRRVGRTSDATRRRRTRRLLHVMLKRWETPTRVLPTLVRVGQRVWAHPSAIVHAGARLVGPIWIGAGVTIGPESVVVGPAILADRVATTVTRPAPLPLTLPRRRRRRRLTAKRVIDVAAATAMLTATAPLVPVIMAAIWIEDGRPFFFRQRRQRRGGRPFDCVKFRTMRNNAELRKTDITAMNVCDGPHFHIENDPRLLRTGRLLRRIHLDELPQLVNVLRGEMSMIGPRPSPDEENRYCPAWREARLSVRPGLTGLWQVQRTRAPNADFQEWIRHDLDYVRRQGWRLDLTIAARTAGQIATRLVPGRRRAA